MHLSQKGYGACPGTFSGYLMAGLFWRHGMGLEWVCPTETGVSGAASLPQIYWRMWGGGSHPTGAHGSGGGKRPLRPDATPDGHRSAGPNENRRVLDTSGPTY